jgi:hypothetical protein
MSKIEMDIERLLHWAYRDELSKRRTSAAEGIWDRIAEDGQRGGIDPGHGAAQRYSHFGLPDPDAEAIEREIALLENVVVDWNQCFEYVAGDLAGLVRVNDIERKPRPNPRQPQASWGKAGEKALKAWWKGDDPTPPHDRPRDVLLVGGISTKVLVTSHAIRGDRPDWREDHPEPRMVPAIKGPNAMIVGECRGRNLYTSGSYCPLKWEPSPVSVLQSRADYLAWRNGLVVLCGRLNLSKFIPLPPKAPEFPWIDPEDEGEIVSILPDEPLASLPLAPIRDRAGPMKRQRRASPVRYPLLETEHG